MSPSTYITKGISMKISKSISAHGKKQTKSIEMLGNSFILAIANIDLTLILFTTISSVTP